jgi:hypothetical protein
MVATMPTPRLHAANGGTAPSTSVVIDSSLMLIATVGLLSALRGEPQEPISGADAVKPRRTHRDGKRLSSQGVTASERLFDRLQQKWPRPTATPGRKPELLTSA